MRPVRAPLCSRIALEAIDCTLALADIYENVALETTDTEASLPRLFDEAKE